MLRKGLTLATVAAATVFGVTAPADAKAKRATAKASAEACQGATVLPSAATANEAERAILCLLNVERTSRGLGRLRSNERLANAAAGHSRDMVRRDYFSHVSLGGSTMGERIREAGYLGRSRSYSIGENLAWGTGDLASPLKIVEAWMRSPGHKRNILYGTFDEVGVGLVLGAPGHGSAGATYTTEFGNRR